MAGARSQQRRIIMKYLEALNYPTRPGGRGWKYAPRESNQAGLARALGGTCCLVPEYLYDWAQHHKIDLLRDVTREDLEPLGALLVAVLNGIPIKEARLAIAVADSTHHEPTEEPPQ